MERFNGFVRRILVYIRRLLYRLSLILPYSMTCYNLAAEKSLCGSVSLSLIFLWVVDFGIPARSIGFERQYYERKE